METIKALIISDGKIGHLNQSIALCIYKSWEYEITNVQYETKLHKTASYLFDKFGVYTDLIFKSDAQPTSSQVIISTGSTTYYPAKVIAKKLGAKIVANMLPKGYKYDDFDYILAQSHDNPPSLANIIELPINLAPPAKVLDYDEMNKRFIFDDSKTYIGVIIGGDNAVFTMDIEQIKALFEYLSSIENVAIVATTSRRTPKHVEDYLASLPLDFLLLYSKDSFNPIPYFLENCKNIVITSDSTSMISEAVVSGNSYVDVLMLDAKKHSKFHSLVENLEKLDAVHIFDSKLGKTNQKINLETYLEKIKI